MTDVTKPAKTPENTRFSSGPCAKRPGWTPQSLDDAWLGRSHRAGGGKAKLKSVIDRTRDVLGVPDDYRIGIVPASDTGAFEMAMWSFLGPRGVQALVWESFGAGWAADIQSQLRLDDVIISKAGYGELPDLGAVDFDRDVVFTWNGTTSGVRVPGGDWIAAGRAGLTLCDATSAVFAQALDWSKLDVTTYSWQKVLGGEAQHGVLILSPRAVERLQTHVPAWPMPKIFRLTKGGKLIEGIFRGETINTPSMLAVEDHLDALDWAAGIGGLPALMARADDNAAALFAWVNASSWIDFLARDPATRSNTSVCLKIVDPDVAKLPPDAQASFAKALAARLDAEGAAFDISNHRDAPPGLRIWCGATVQTADIEVLCQWLDWGFAAVKSELEPVS